MRSMSEHAYSNVGQPRDPKGLYDQEGDMIETVQFGTSGLRVSQMALGTMMFGTQADPTTARAIADYALDHGVYFWDTADMYGSGASEEVCGQLLKGRRDEVVLATKVYAPMSDRPND